MTVFGKLEIKSPFTPFYVSLFAVFAAIRGLSEKFWVN